MNHKLREKIAWVETFENRVQEGDPTLLDSDLEALRLFPSLAIPKHPRHERSVRIGKYERVRFARITRNIPPNFNLIDIGLGDGFMSSLLCMNSSPKNYMGIDISQSSVDSCLELMSANGLENIQFFVLDAMTGEAQEQIGAAARVDPSETCVLLFEVLEHLTNAHVFLEQLGSSLVTGNKLLLTIPLLGKIEHFRTHLQFVPCRTLVSLLCQLGFEIEDLNVIAGTWLFVACRYTGLPSASPIVNVELPRVLENINTLENHTVEANSLPSPVKPLKRPILFDPRYPSQWARIHLAFSGTGTAVLRVLERTSGAIVATKLFNIKAEKRISFAARGSESQQHLVFQLTPIEPAACFLNYSVLGVDILMNYPNVWQERGGRYDEEFK